MTSIELPPDLYAAARLYAIRHGMTFRAFVERTLREVLARKEEKTR